MITGLLARILGTDNARQIKQLRPLVSHINSLETTINILSDEELGNKTNEFRQQISNGKKLDDILPEAFAVVREMAKRKLSQRHFDVQLIGGIALHQGKIAEMKTGEGKTLTATLPLYLNALGEHSAHLVTVNDYLARRDSEWMSPIFNSLGLSISCLQNDMNDEERKKVYNSDIIYATNNELGFDYLRDNMKFDLESYVQRKLHFAIVDEIDSILIDEARTPLIISGAADKSSKLYIDTNQVIKYLKKETDFEIDEKAKSVQLTEAGTDKIEAAFNIANLYAIDHLALLHHCMQALKAHALFKRDVDYVVKDKQVLIVDEFTGRILPGRRYSDGLHQALEAKEGVDIERESQTLASITLQNYFRLYDKLAGMTGTAMTESEEFYKIYKLNVLAIPTNRPLIRKDEPDLIFLTQQAKYKAIVEDIKARHEKGQPVLIGTIAIEISELLSTILRSHGIKHEVLNAKQHEREAEIVEFAGKPGQITIATNMAGRGTDIKLTQESLDAGGLYILGTERHESRRIDNQLRGRSGRQGDPGESRFYISLEDNLIRVFAGDTLKSKMQWAGMQEDEVIESKFVSRTIERSQEKVEKHNFEIRKHLLEYDDVLNQQRMVIYGYRRDILQGDKEIYELIRDLLIKAVQDIIEYFCPNRTLNKPAITNVYAIISKMTGLAPTELINSRFNETNSDLLKKDIINFLLKKYTLLRGELPEEFLKHAEKALLLQTIDQAWKNHMLNLDHLKEGINLRSWGQKNPLIEYKKEAFTMFKDMMRQINADVVHHVFHMRPTNFDHHHFEKQRQEELEALNMSSHASKKQGNVNKQQPAQSDKVQRNDPCTCGSGKKYKKCCGS